MAETFKAAVTVKPLQIKLEELSLPEIGEDAGILKVEASSVCGSDWPTFNKKDVGPYILGHENVGRVYKIGRLAQQKWGIKEGDRIALEEYIPCGICKLCRSGAFRDCLSTDSRRSDSVRYGMTAMSVKPGLFGGYSQYLYIHPNAVVHKIPENIPAEVASLHLVIANGIQWVQFEGGAQIGDVVIVQGPGRQGISCAIAAKAAGASSVILTGISSDETRLAFAKKVGIDHTINVEKENLEERVRDITGGEMADVVVDVASGGANTIATAMKVVRKRGSVVLAAPKLKPLTSFNMDEVISKHLTVKGARGHSYKAVDRAIQVIATQQYPLEEMCTHNFTLEQAEEALLTAGRKQNLDAIQGTIIPWS